MSGEQALEKLASGRCRPCEGGTPPVERARAEGLAEALPGWRISEDGKSLRRELVMRDFLAAVELIGKVAAVAEAEDHHPDLHLTGYRKLAVELSTHSIGGLSENDFILAAKIEKLPKALKT